MRSLMIDARTVRFCTPEMIERLRRSTLLSSFLENNVPKIDAFIPAVEIPAGKDAAANHFDNRVPTNLGLFRAYIIARLRADKRVNSEMTLMVRQLEPTPTGIPLQLYFFTDTVVWTEYEAIQSDVFDHLLAIISEFDLRIYQRSADTTV